MTLKRLIMFALAGAIGLTIALAYLAYVKARRIADVTKEESRVLSISESIRKAVPCAHSTQPSEGDLGHPSMYVVPLDIQRSILSGLPVHRIDGVIDREGISLDHWGNEHRLVAIITLEDNSASLLVVSAGPDRLFGTSDDIATGFSACKRVFASWGIPYLSPSSD